MQDVTTLNARFYGHSFSGKPRFSGQYCYDGTTVFSNSGNFNIADTFGGNFCSIFLSIPNVKGFNRDVWDAQALETLERRKLKKKLKR